MEPTIKELDEMSALGGRLILRHRGSRSDDIARPNATGIRFKSWMRVGLFADELARLSPVENPVERLQTKDLNELSVLRTWGGT
jgi:hypothetical protein